MRSSFQRMFGILFVVCCLLFGTGGIGQAAQLDHDAAILVLPMQNKTKAIFENALVSAEENLVYELEDSQAFSHVYRDKDVKSALDEQALRGTGVMQESQIANMAGQVKARYVLYSSLVGLSVKGSEGQISVQNTGGFADTGSGKSVSVSAMVSLKVVDRQTGESVFWGHGEGESKSFKFNESAILIHVGSEAAPAEQCNNAIMKALHDVVDGKEGLKTTLCGKG